MKSWTGMILAGLVMGFGGSAYGAEEVRDMPPFKRLAADGAFDLVVNGGMAQSVVVETSQRQLSLVGTRVVDGELHIFPRGSTFNHGITIWITVPVLEQVVLQGASDISIDGIDSESFALGIIGAGDARLIGVCGNLVVEIEGSGDVDAESLECEAVAVEVTGAGDVAVFATDTVSVRVAGSGNVDVYGHPRQIEQIALGGAASIQVR